LSFDRVTVRGVTKVFDRQRALAGVDLELRAGRMCALLGPNGAGKSTLLGILSTLTRPTSGEVRYGELTHDVAARKLRGAIGLVAHESFLYADLTARENLRFWEGLYGVRGRAQGLLARVGLEHAADRPVRTYSRGMQQRLALARALVSDPRLVLLDEPFTGLDKSGVEALREILRELRASGAILLLVTHDFQAAAGLCDQVIILRRGKVALDEARGDPYRDLSEVYSAHA
jgi:heme exporter protein A